MFLCTFHCPLQVSVFPFEASGVSSSSSSSSKEHGNCGLGWFIFTVPTHWLHISETEPVLPVEKKQHHSEKQAAASHQDRLGQLHKVLEISRGSTVPPSPCWKQEKQCQGWHSFAPRVSPPQCRRCEPHQLRQEQREDSQVSAGHLEGGNDPSGLTWVDMQSSDIFSPSHPLHITCNPMFHGSMESVLSAFFLGCAGSSLLALPTHTTLSCTGAASGVGKSNGTFL